jgi:hypothetical protein
MTDTELAIADFESEGAPVSVETEPVIEAMHASQLVSELESAYADLRERHPELPDVIIVVSPTSTTSGRNSKLAEARAPSRRSCTRRPTLWVPLASRRTSPATSTTTGPSR